MIETRESLAMTQTQFAELLLVSQAAVSRWETDARPILPSTADHIRLKVAEYRRLHRRRPAAASPAA